MNLTVEQKLELIRKLGNGASVKLVCKEYGLKNVSFIRKAKSKHTEYALKYFVGGYSSKFGSVAARKHMKFGSQKELDKAVYKWS